MLDKIPLTPDRNIAGLQRIATSSTKKTGSANAPEQGAAFQALLEKLETQARDLEEKSGKVESPADLAGAVDRAQASLHDALSLGDQLLEAYREALQRSDSTGANGSAARARKLAP